MFKGQIPKVLTTLFISNLIIYNAYANTIVPSDMEHAEHLKVVEINDADCVIKNGKLITLQNTNPDKTLEVWVDRWFMDVQTADHTKQVLLSKAEPTALGCSTTLSGPQHWTIYSIKLLNTQ